MSRVVDTNVPIVVKRALEHPDERPQDLVDACEEVLEEILTGKLPVATDLDGEIVSEYFHELARSGRPTLGDEFAKYVHDYRFTWESKYLPQIDPVGENSYGALGDDEKDIDPSDRKFVATAKMADVPIVQATDTKWLDWADVLGRHGVEVNYAHEPSIRAMYKAKFGREAP